MSGIHDRRLFLAQI